MASKASKISVLSHHSSSQASANLAPPCAAVRMHRAAGRTKAFSFSMISIALSAPILGWWIVTRMVRPLLLMFLTACITITAARASSPAAVRQQVRAVSKP